MQPVTVLAFRKRLKKRGYTDISIILHEDPETYKLDGKYLVCAREPLAGQYVRKVCTIEFMHNAFRF